VRLAQWHRTAFRLCLSSPSAYKRARASLAISKPSLPGAYEPDGLAGLHDEIGSPARPALVPGLVMFLASRRQRVLCRPYHEPCARSQKAYGDPEFREPGLHLRKLRGLRNRVRVYEPRTGVLH